MIDPSKLKAARAHISEPMGDSEEFEAQRVAVVAAIDLVLAAQAAPSARDAALQAYYGDDWSACVMEAAMDRALLAAALHRPVEARVTEEAVRVASATLERELERCGIITTVTPMIARLVLEAVSLPSPQVTRGEVEAVVDHEIGHLHPHRADLVAGILALFGKKTA